MSIEGLDAALPIETTPLLPLAGVAEAGRADSGPTLDDALKRGAQAGDAAAPAAHAPLDREAMREATALDLWIEGATGTAFRSSIGGAGAFIGDSNAISIDPDTAGDGGFILRELSLAEKKLVAGGLGTTDPADPPIVVTAHPPPPPHYWDDHPFDPEDNDSDPDGGWTGQGGPEEPAPQDSDEHEIRMNEITRSLTPEEQAAIGKLRAAIARMDNLLASLPSTATFTMKDGTVVTIAQLRAAWAATDFRIVDNNVPFNNGSTALPGVGAADFNGGDPILSIKIGDLIGWMATNASANLYILHDLAHVTSAGQAYWSGMYAPGSEGGATRTDAEHAANEQWANDFARAIANATGAPVSPNPWGGYSSTPPTYSSGITTEGTSGTGGTGGGGEINHH